MEMLLEQVSFEGPDRKKKTVKLDAAYVKEQFTDAAKNQELSRYVLQQRLTYNRGIGPWRSLASALAWGARGPEFKSRRPDQITLL